MLVIELPDAELERLKESVDLDRGSELTVDLDRRAITAPDGREVPFALDESVRQRLLSGADDIDQTLRYETEIAAYEEART